MERYSIITEKNPREILLLRGSGCRWRRCRFCDYHLDFSTDATANYKLNQAELAKVTGRFGRLEVINSGSFSDLDQGTFELIQKTCVSKSIGQIHFECHWKDRDNIPGLRKIFENLGVRVKIKIGVETFDALYRESFLDKGISETDPAKIAENFDECCLLFGLPGQSVLSMENDIKTGLSYFERICINIMVKNSTPVLPDPEVIKAFSHQIAPKYIENPRVDILMNNTDFGVGGEKNA